MPRLGPGAVHGAAFGLLALGALGAVGALPAPAAAQAPAVPRTSPGLTVLVPAAVMHAVEGISFGNDGMLYGTSIHGQSVYRIDPRSGAVGVVVPAPDGESDDVAIGPPGTPAAGVLAWTAQKSGEIRILRPGGTPQVVMRNVPRVNPIAFNAQGRLFTAQLGAGEDRLWELYLGEDRAPREVARNQGKLNGFDFGPDGRLYAPLFGTDRLVAIDVETGAFTPVGSGVGSPSAVKVDRQGRLYSVDYLKGDLWRTDPAAAESRLVAHVREPIDNLAIGPDGTVYVSGVADSRIIALDIDTGTQREVVAGWFTIPLGMSLVRRDGQDTLLVADPFGYRFVDPASGAVDRPPWAANRGASAAVAGDERFIATSQAAGGRVRKIDRRSDRLLLDSTAVQAPRGIALDGQGEILVVDAASGELLRVTATGVETLARGLGHPVGLALEGSRFAWVTDYAGGTLQRVRLATGAVRVRVRGLEHPTGLARLRDGRWAVVEPDRGRVLALDPRTARRTILASGLALALDGLDLPADSNAGIAVGSDGAVFVSCPGNNSVVKIQRPARGPPVEKGRS